MNCTSSLIFCVMHLHFVGFIDFKENVSICGLCGSKTDEVTWQCTRLHSEAFRDLYFSPIIFWVSNQEEWDVRYMLHVYGGREDENTGFWWANLLERGYF
jgi:hypothetical protein